MCFRRLPVDALIATWVFALVCATSGALHAQDLPAPAHIAFADGSVLLDHEGQTLQAVAGAPFLPGDRLRTGASRAEVLFPDGSALNVDEYSSIDLQAPTLMRLTGGRVIVQVAAPVDPASAMPYQVDTPVASAMLDGAGEYRVALLSGPAGTEAELAVVRGSGLLRTERGSMSLRAGERSLARDFEAPSMPQIFNSARFDAFDRWAALRRDARLGTAQSAQYLPRDLQMYGSTLDRYGAWQYEAPYGSVWYPAVAPDWRPYYNGYWSSNRRYGWTWIGLDVWGWPTHHYGRWGHARNRWFWIPDRRWGPAWVTWAAAPGFVSWCPLGFDNRAVFALSVNAGNPWRGWVVLPRTRFGARGAHVNRYAVARLPATAPVVIQATAPDPPRAGFGRSAQSAAPGVDFAVPRNGTRDVAVPRAGPRASVSGAATPRGADDAQGVSAVPSGQASRSRVASGRRLGVAQDRGPSVAQGRESLALAQGTASDVAQGFSPAVGDGSSAIKQPLAEAPRAYRRNSGFVAPRQESGPTAPPAVDRAPSPPTASPWYGQSGPWYGSRSRVAPRGDAATEAQAAPENAPARRNPGYVRRPEVAAPAVQAPQPSAAPGLASAPRASAPRWGAPVRSRPAESAPPAAAPPAASPSRAPAAVPRSGRAERGAPASAPAAGPSGEASPRHAPSSRRPN